MDRNRRLLAMARIGFAILLCWELALEWRTFRDGGYFASGFHLPALPFLPTPSAEAFTWLCCARLLAVALAVLGIYARAGLMFGALTGIYVLLLDRLGYHHNRYALFLFVFLLAFTPCDQQWSLRKTPIPSFMIGARALKLQIALIYLASSISKLLDVDWRSGLVLQVRMLRHLEQTIARGVPASIANFLVRDNTALWLARGAIATELLLALALQSKRLRKLAIGVGIVFHLAIELTSNVEGFTGVMLVGYVVVLTNMRRSDGLPIEVDDLPFEAPNA
jgi:hypothetical protein